MKRGYGQLIADVLNAVEQLRITGIDGPYEGAIQIEDGIKHWFEVHNLDARRHRLVLDPELGELIFLGSASPGRGHSYYAVVGASVAYLSYYHSGNFCSLRLCRKYDVPIEFLARLAQELPAHLIAQWQEQQHGD